MGTILTLSANFTGRVFPTSFVDPAGNGIPIADFGDLTIQVGDGANRPPVINSAAVASVPENQTSAIDVNATDADGDTLTYSISGGADQNAFAINAATGIVTFNSAPDFENPTDAGANNVYDVQVTATDGNDGSTSQDIAITVTDANEAGVDLELVPPANVGVISEELIGGVLTTVIAVAPGIAFEVMVQVESAPQPVNSYQLNFQASDQALGLMATNAEFVVGSKFSRPVPGEQGLDSSTSDFIFSAALPPGGTPTTPVPPVELLGIFTVTAPNTPDDYRLTSMTPSDELTSTFVTNAAGDQQAPIDDFGDLIIRVTSVNRPPVINSAAAASVPENQTSAIDVNATDADNDTLTYAISGGADQNTFAINAATGVVTFKSAPDFENPSDVGANNVYDVRVTVTDGNGGATSQAITITVTDVNEQVNRDPVINSAAAASVPENQTSAIDVNATDADNDTLTYAISGGADQNTFAINAATGVVTFKSAPDFENPSDVGANNVYDVRVTVTDGNGGATSQAITITVTDVNEQVNRDPVINSAAAASVPENQTSAIDVNATDADNDTLTYAISGGADQNTFAINAATGVVTFKSAPDFENPSDAGANNVYNVRVTVTDGNGGAASQAITITVTDRPGGDSRIIIPEFVARPHLIPGDERPTAILFRALSDTTLTVSQVGVASLKQQISLVDVNLASLGGRDDFGHYTADLIGGGMYALIFEAQSTDAIFLVRSSQGYQSLSGSVPTNILNPTDVNADGQSTAQDALLIINQMSHQNIGEGEDVRAEQRPGRYYDVNRDGRVTAGDALRVINNLNNRNRRGEGEVLAIPNAIQLVDADANDDDERPDTAPVDLVTISPPGKFDGATPERLGEDVLEIDFATAVKTRVSNFDELLSDESLDDLLPY